MDKYTVEREGNKILPPFVVPWGNSDESIMVEKADVNKKYYTMSRSGGNALCVSEDDLYLLKYLISRANQRPDIFDVKLPLYIRRALLGERAVLEKRSLFGIYEMKVDRGCAKVQRSNLRSKESFELPPLRHGAEASERLSKLKSKIKLLKCEDTMDIVGDRIVVSWNNSLQLAKRADVIFRCRFKNIENANLPVEMAQKCEFYSHAEQRGKLQLGSGYMIDCEFTGLDIEVEGRGHFFRCTFEDCNIYTNGELHGSVNRFCGNCNIRAKENCWHLASCYCYGHGDERTIIEEM